MAKELCYGKVETIWLDAGKHRDPSIGFGLAGEIVRPKNVRRIRLTCPLCGRRILSSIRLDHDGIYIIHSLPPHKPKGWWKKSKRITKNERKIY